MDNTRDKLHSLMIAGLAKEKGNVAFKAGDYATARSLFSHAMEFDPSNHIYPLNRSQANLKLGRWDETESDATKTLDLSPRNLKALLRRAKARKELRKWDGARVDIQMFIDNKGDTALGAEELKAIAFAESSPPSEGTISDLDSSLAQLHLQNDDSSCFHIRTSAAPGLQNAKGAFASRDIHRGDFILSEKPIFSMPSKGIPSEMFHFVESVAKNLSPAHLDSYLSLENSHKTCSCFRHPLLGIFGTNAFGISSSFDDAGICLTASRFNHSCSPNATFSYNSKTKEIRIYALGTIPCGEEIFVGYLVGECLYGSPRKIRQANLRRRYHFTCACSVCSLPEAEAKMSDARRQKVVRLLEAKRRLSFAQPVQWLNIVVEVIHLFQEEGHLADMHSLTNSAVIVCTFNLDWVSASYWANLTYTTAVAEFGEDSPQVVEVREMFLPTNPKLFQFAGSGPFLDLTRIRI